MPIPEGNSLVQNSTYLANGSYTGLLTQTLHDNLYPDYGKDYTSNGSPVFFSTVFGVLFSGVTGIMAGANMSGKSYLSIRSSMLLNITRLMLVIKECYCFIT